MKRTLVLGCAAVALCAVAGTASAQSKFQLNVGGDALFQGAYIGQDRDEGLRNTEFRNRFRLVVTPTAKADNGMEYGARARLLANNTNATMSADRGFIFAQGGFGTVQAGVINGLSDEYGIIGPNVEGIAGGPDNSTLEFLGGSSTFALGPANTVNFRNLISGDVGTKVVYLTPTFSGFQAGIAYTPRTGSVLSDVNRRKRDIVAAASQRTFSFQDIVEFGGMYKNEFSNGVSLEASAFYQFGSATNETVGVRANNFSNLNSVHVGANVGYAGFKVGASYANAGTSGYGKRENGFSSRENQDVWVVGANYTTGPWILAANYLRSKDAGDLTVAGSAKLDLWQAGVAYTVAPGMTVGLEYSYFKFNSELSAAQNPVRPGTNPDDKGSIIMLDTRIAF